MATASNSATPRDGYFLHHGIWAPGIRLFRQLGFGVKAALVSLCFLVPLAVVTGAWFHAQQSQVTFSAKERDALIAGLKTICDNLSDGESGCGETMTETESAAGTRCRNRSPRPRRPFPSPRT